MTVTMKINVLFFGVTRDLTGLSCEQVEIPDGERVDYVWRYYERRFPRLKEMGDLLLTAVNQEIVQESRSLHDGDEVAFLPPVSGGAPKEASDGDIYRITHEVIATSQLAQELKRPAAGAVVVFEGIVRDHSQDRRTLYLEYEGYEPMAIRKMRDIGRDIRAKFPIEAIGMVHRLGRLEIGETSVAIVISSAHRGAAFEVCRYAIDRLKQLVPIWKKEYFEDGSAWAEGEGQTRLLAEARR
jgi:molybdopterin synthase catalytic subunit